MAREKLKKPPLNLVTLQVLFPHNLRIAEAKSEFYKTIKDDFPTIIFPETKDLTFNLSDCNFRNEGATSQIRLGTSYCTIEAVGYEKVDQFWGMFDNVFQKLQDNFSVAKVTQTRLVYDNIIIMNSKKIGDNFSDYFTYEMKLTDTEHRQFMTMDGMFVYKVQDGFLKVDLRVRQDQGTKQWDRFSFNIDCGINKEIDVINNRAELKKQFEYAHTQIEEIFFNSLTKKYLDLCNE